MKPSRMMGEEQGRHSRHSSLNVEGSEFYRKMRAEAKAKEEKEERKRILAAQISTEEAKKKEEEVEEEEEGAEETSCNFFEAQAWNAPTIRSNFFEEHDEWETTEEAEDDPSGLPSQFQFERPSNAGPTTQEED